MIHHGLFGQHAAWPRKTRKTRLVNPQGRIKRRLNTIDLVFIVF
jgi:hypothetical protein